MLSIAPQSITVVGSQHAPRCEWAVSTHHGVSGVAIRHRVGRGMSSQCCPSREQQAASGCACRSTIYRRHWLCADGFRTEDPCLCPRFMALPQKLRLWPDAVQGGFDGCSAGA